MKKMTLLAFLALGLSLTSCKKDRTCNCTVAITDTTTENDNGTVTVNSSAYTATYIYKMKEISKTGANGACPSGKTTTKSTENVGGGITYTYETIEDATCTVD